MLHQFYIFHPDIFQKMNYDALNIQLLPKKIKKINFFLFNKDLVIFSSCYYSKAKESINNYHH